MLRTAMKISGVISHIKGIVQFPVKIRTVHAAKVMRAAATVMVRKICGKVALTRLFSRCSTQTLI